MFFSINWKAFFSDKETLWGKVHLHVQHHRAIDIFKQLRFGARVHCISCPQNQSSTTKKTTYRFIKPKTKETKDWKCLKYFESSSLVPSGQLKIYTNTQNELKRLLKIAWFLHVILHKRQVSWKNVEVLRLRKSLCKQNSCEEIISCL